MRRLNRGGCACLALAVCAATSVGLRAQTFTTMLSFDGTDGQNPDGALLQATDGNIYGTTLGGGANLYGTIFKITAGGTLTTLYNFCFRNGCHAGSTPTGLVQATDGDFYGTDGGGAYGSGTVFRITSSGNLKTLYTFVCSMRLGCANGAGPSAGLVQATNGNFYGTTVGGGANGDGTVFKITPGGTLTTLYSFCSQSGCADGYQPAGALVQASNGSLYGVTEYGGIYNSGTVFQITPTGTFATLYNFCSQSGCTDGSIPIAALVQAPGGNFYGTTEGGGTNGYGTVFKLTPGGTLTTLYSFCSESGCTDGEGPGWALVPASDGNFYGTTSGGGAGAACTDACGTIFKITPGGTLTTLYSFCSEVGCTDGAEPVALIQDTNGSFYGTTVFGGANGCAGGTGCGTVFSLSVGLDPFVETQPTSGKVAKAVKILGTNLTGATSVTFNGTAATFTVASSSLITTTVPAGATTGTVQVVTPGGTLTSDVPFRVIP